MADVTINELTRGVPAGNSIVPYSTSSVTLGVQVSAMFQNTGNVGINTTNVPSTLTVNGDMHLLAYGKLNFSNTAGTSYINAPQSNHLALHTAGESRIRIDSVGNVGIGTSTPNTKLHVNGTITCTNTVINGVRTMYFSGLNNGNQTISCTVYLNQGNPVKVQCSFNHWSQPEYNATRESYIGASHYADPYVPMLVDDILNKSSTLGGGWSFSRPVTNANPGPGYTYPISDKLVITKSAGTYVGSSHWWIKIEGNAVGLGVYPA